VAGTPRKPNEKLAQKLKTKHLALLQKVLILTGKPLYLLLSFTLVALFFLSSWFKRAARKVNLIVIFILFLFFIFYSLF
jgi:hypothetical protein